MDDPEEPRPPSASQLSKTPSWVMLGFVLGALVVLALPRPEKKAAPPPVVVVAPPPPQPLTVERAVFFEDVFAELNRSAIWQDDVTEVAFWNASRRAFSDCYEVLKIGDKFYFRSIPRLTRPVLKEGVPGDSPLQFTVPAGAKVPRSGSFNHGEIDQPVIDWTRNTLRAPLVVLPPEKPTFEKPPVDIPSAAQK